MLNKIGIFWHRNVNSNVMNEFILVSYDINEIIKLTLPQKNDILRYKLKLFIHRQFTPYWKKFQKKLPKHLSSDYSSQ